MHQIDLAQKIRLLATALKLKSHLRFNVATLSSTQVRDLIDAAVAGVPKSQPALGHHDEAILVSAMQSVRDAFSREVGARPPASAMHESLHTAIETYLMNNQDVLHEHLATIQAIESETDAAEVEAMPTPS